MKKRLFAFIFAAAVSTVVSVSAGHAQTSQAIEVDIPFEFTTNNGTLPAGTYRIASASDSRALWRIRPTDNQPGEFLLALTLAGAKEGELGLTFHRYGDRHFLTGFKTASYAITLPVPKGERLLKSHLGPTAQVEVIRVKTVDGGSR